jgi:membrane protease YdiL (CAAX protease family)
MTQDQIESAGASRSPRRFRYLIDIVILVAVVFGIEAAAVAVYTPKNMQSGLVFDAAIQMFQVLIACVLIWLRGERLADIGLKQPTNWWKTFLFGIAIAAVVFAGMYISEKAGFRRDLSRFKDVQGNLELAIYGVFYALIGAGFYEEFMFRGFLMQGFAMLFSGNRGGWIIANVMQAVLFGVSHAYQNPLGMAITGTLALVMGFLVLASGRNLWLVIIGHGLYDASRFVLFYFQGPPAG